MKSNQLQKDKVELKKKDILYPTSFKSIMRFQQKDESLIEITKEKPKDYSIKQYNRAGKKYSPIC